MKYLIGFFIFISLTVQAQECPATSKEMGQYFSQKSWSPYEVKNSSMSQGVRGYLDEQGGFHFESMSRQVRSQIKILMNADNDDFFNDCENLETKGRYLRLKRVNHANNRFLFSVRFLPALTGFANNPLKDQDLKNVDIKVQLNLSEDSLVQKYDFRPQAFTDEVRRKIYDQVAASTSFGSYQIDLSGMDDLVCDLVQGKATLSVQSSFISKAPLVVQKQVFNPQDLQTVYHTLTNGLSKSAGKEETLFTAGRLMAELELQHRLHDLRAERSFFVIEKLMNQKMDQVLSLDASQLSCLINQMQSYEQDKTLRHYISVKMIFPGLDELRSETQGN